MPPKRENARTWAEAAQTARQPSPPRPYAIRYAPGRAGRRAPQQAAQQESHGGVQLATANQHNAQPTSSEQAAEDRRVHGPPTGYVPKFLLDLNEHIKVFGALKNKAPVQLVWNPIMPRDLKWHRCEQWVLSLGHPDAVAEHGFRDVDPVTGA